MLYFIFPLSINSFNKHLLFPALKNTTEFPKSVTILSKEQPQGKMRNQAIMPKDANDKLYKNLPLC